MSRRLFLARPLPIVAALALAACSDGGTAEPGFHPAPPPPFHVTTADGREWSGLAAEVSVREGRPGTPAEAMVSFWANDGAGLVFNALSVLEPSQLVAGAWSVAVDHEHPTSAGFGTIGNGAGLLPISAPGFVGATLVDGRLEGTLSVDAESMPMLVEASFAGPYHVSCALVATEAPPQEGSVGSGPGEGGWVLVEDTSFTSPFCAPFADL